MAGEYWFTPEQLAEMARPTMDSALEALEAENYEKVAALCESMNSIAKISPIIVLIAAL